MPRIARKKITFPKGTRHSKREVTSASSDTGVKSIDKLDQLNAPTVSASIPVIPNTAQIERFANSKNWKHKFNNIEERTWSKEVERRTGERFVKTDIIKKKKDNSINGPTRTSVHGICNSDDNDDLPIDLDLDPQNSDGTEKSVDIKYEFIIEQDPDYDQTISLRNSYSENSDSGDSFLGMHDELLMKEDLDEDQIIKEIEAAHCQDKSINKGGTSLFTSTYVTPSSQLPHPSRLKRRTTTLIGRNFDTNTSSAFSKTELELAQMVMKKHDMEIALLKTTNHNINLVRDLRNMQLKKESILLEIAKKELLIRDAILDGKLPLKHYL